MFREIFLAILIFNLTFSSDIDLLSEFPDLESPWDNPQFADIFDNLKTSDITTNVEGNGRIINGLPATLGQFPYVMFIFTKGNNNKSSICGGSLIKRDWILTAGHCMADKNSGVVIGGVTDLENGKFEWGERINESQIFIHSGFLFEKYIHNDIALIKLSRKIPCNKYIGIIDLPCSCDEIYELNGTEAVTMGFGSTTGFKTDVSNILNYATLEVIENCECKQLVSIPVFDSMLCTSTASGKSDCFGDSGSSLVANILGRNVLVGVVSFGNKECKTGKEYPNVYTRVSSYMPWIEHITSNH